jgi:hypothetical protein
MRDSSQRNAGNVAFLARVGIRGELSIGRRHCRLKMNFGDGSGRTRHASSDLKTGFARSALLAAYGEICNMMKSGSLTTLLFPRESCFRDVVGLRFTTTRQLYRPVSPQFASFHSREPGWRGVVVSLDAEIRAGGVRPESAFIVLQPKIPVETKAIAPTDNACFTPLDK